jgi:hypothetical protein
MVHPRATDFYGGGPAATVADVNAVHYRYSEWLAWGDEPFQSYTPASGEGTRPLDAYSHSPPRVRGAGLPTHQEVCLNFLFVHKAVDGILGAAFVPGTDEDGESSGGVCSTTYTFVPIRELGDPQAAERWSVVAKNTGFATSFCLSCGGDSAPGPTSPFTLGHTVIHELGHSFGSPHDGEAAFPNREPECYRALSERYIMHPSAILLPTSHYDGDATLEFSPCSHERVSQVVHIRRAGGTCFQAPELGACGCVQCGGPCSKAYCNLATGRCEDVGLDRADGWPCDTNPGTGTGTVGVCLGGSCAIRRSQSGFAVTVPAPLFGVSVYGTDPTAVAGAPTVEPHGHRIFITMPPSNDDYCRCVVAPRPARPARTSQSLPIARSRSRSR